MRFAPGGERTSIGAARWFVVLMFVLIGAACSSDSDSHAPEGESQTPEPLTRTIPTPTPAPDIGPTLADHWHKGFGVYVCDRWLPNPQSEFDPTGIHSHRDGLIHIHPFYRDVTRDRATLSLFMDAMFMELTDDELNLSTLEGKQQISASDTKCDGKPTTAMVAIWDAPPETVPTGKPDRIVTSDLLDIVFEEDGGALAIAFVPDGAEIPVPPSSERLANLDDPTPQPLGPVDGEQPTVPRTAIEIDPDGTITLDADGNVFLPTSPANPLGSDPSDPTFLEPQELSPVLPELLFLPVLQVTEPDAAQARCFPAMLVETACFVLGENPRVDPSAVSAALAVPDPAGSSEWHIELTLTQLGTEAFNRLADQCFAFTPKCPTGQLAIVFDIVGSETFVLSAPLVNGQDFEASDVTIVGAFPQDLAERLAELINEAAAA